MAVKNAKQSGAKKVSTKKPPTSKKLTKKTTVSTKAAKKTAKKPSRVKQAVVSTSERRKQFLARRPHRSFRLTRRRDYIRSLKLPGYWALTVAIWRLLKKNWRTFACLVALYAVLSMLLTTVLSQDTYLQVRQVVDEANEDGFLGTVLPTLTIFMSVLGSQVTGGGVTVSAGSPQQIIAVLIGLYAWLTTVWLLRAMMAGKQPKMRDGLYSAGSPVIALGALAVILLVQLLPAAIAVIIYGAADGSGLLDQTAALMLAGGATGLVAVLSLYWITSTSIAMVIVTLPGMYPMKALRLAGDIAVGRRIRILLRLTWLVVLLLLAWAVVLIPTIVLDGALASAMPIMANVPIVPMAALLLASFSVVFSASYVYVLYRKVVEDDSAPA
jgi:hypothetical protein